MTKIIECPSELTLDQKIDFAIKCAKQQKSMATIEISGVLLSVYPWSTHAASKSIYLLSLKEKEILLQQKTR